MRGGARKFLDLILTESRCATMFRPPREPGGRHRRTQLDNLRLMTHVTQGRRNDHKPALKLEKRETELLLSVLTENTQPSLLSSDTPHTLTSCSSELNGRQSRLGLAGVFCFTTAWRGKHQANGQKGGPSGQQVNR